jgi:Tol biopolymer transport system component
MRAFIGVFSAILTLLSASVITAASFPTELRFRTLKGHRLSVHYPRGLEEPARRALVLGEEILARHQARYVTRIRRVHVVLADVEDDPNGFASPLPYPLVHLRLVAGSGADDLGNYEEWLRMLLTHELAHVVHLEEARGWWGVGRVLLGRAPFLFPNALSPMWTIEGLATYEETEDTAFGRGRDPDSRMVIRMEAVERGLPREDEPVLGLDRWPGGNAGYLFGQSFLRYTEERFGPGTLPRLARSHAGETIPYLDEVTFKRVTGRGLHGRWEEWRRAVGEELRAEAEAIAARGVTPSQALTARGIRQVGARWSPDGEWIAYTSRTLTRQRELRVMRADGSGDRALVWRNGGSELAWTPDGQTLVFDDVDRHRLFTTRFDLRAVRVRDGRARWLTSGLRAQEPDVSADGRQVVFVRQHGDRSDLALVGLDGKGLRELTRSEVGVQWSSPAFAPDGASVVAARWTAGGWLDLVQVDVATGATLELTHDRAKDAEPAFSRDGAHVVFRSDRDGASNVYALRLTDRALLRVTNVTGGAFLPDVSPDGGRLLFSNYSARGYDVHVAPLDLAALPPAAPFADPYPPPQPAGEPQPGEEKAYQPLPTALPRFWTPYFDTGGEGTSYGVATAGTDPLLRHAWALDVHWNTAIDKLSGRGIYQYDRFRPTFYLLLEETNEVLNFASGPAATRDRELILQASYPLVRRLRQSQSLSLAWRRERETILDGPDAASLDLGGVEAAWTLSSARQYPYSISPVEGVRLRVAALVEDPGLGSDVALTKLTADVRGYLRVFGETDALALRVGGGGTIGEPGFRQSYAVGGFPDASLLDVVRTNPSVLRGYPRNAFLGRSFVHANAEYRFPLAHPQRGWRTVPLFVRHLHAAVFADAGHAWTGSFELADVKTSVGAVLGADVFVGQGLPLTLTLGLAQGLSDRGETQVYFRTGLSF